MFHKIYIIDSEHAAWENTCKSIIREHKDVFVEMRCDREERRRYSRLLKEIFKKHPVIDTIIDFGVIFEDDIHAICIPIETYRPDVL